MVKRAIVVLAEGFEEIEAITVIDILRRARIEVTVAGLTDLKVEGSHGIKVIADKKMEDIDADFDACVFPGGIPGAEYLAASGEIQKLINEMHLQKKIIAAICASPALVLAPMGILEERRATCYPGMQTHFDQKISYSTENVVVDDNIITSRGPATALEFSLAIVKKLVEKETADKVRKAVLAD